MKIAVMSTYAWLKRANNYGTLLQYVALQQHLQKLGHEVFWIRYDPRPAPTNEGLHGLVKLPPKLIHRMQRTVQRVRNRRMDGLKSRCSVAFRLFMDEYVNFSPIEYRSPEEMYSNPPEADIYVAGSDQVWRGIDRAYYLDFVPPGKRRYAYAASFGKPALATEHTSIIAPMLEAFERISVRESEGVDICRKAGRDDVVRVLDPTFLLGESEYRALEMSEGAPDIASQPYLFSYFVNVRNAADVHWKSVESFSKEESLNLRVVPIQGAEYAFPGRYVCMPPPREFLWLIRNAACMVTNSFHGTVFALIMEKPFLVVLQPGKTSQQNGRISSLLEDFGLKSRLYPGPHQAGFASQMKQTIDWQSVRARKEAYVRRSKMFLGRCTR